ncbi:hypothetical protein COS86_05320 [Candidatus Bathyarchaeota archaeon CG07_land_8_20_14_0_80_47_9]|nr:MAG: hypothetical protein COS86_05320 [Candidatus Bathyarchaeota archaeon CG07_land_8_20_14_0_80_47_9]
MVERIKSGRDSEIKQKLVSSIHKKIVVANDLPKDIVIDTEECVDGSRPSILIRIKRIIGRKKTRICR